MGGNDYMALTSGPNQSSVITSEYKRKYMGMVLGNFTSVIKAVYDKGGRKFGFQNVGPLGCMPASKSMAASTMPTPGNTTEVNCIKEPQILAKVHNIALSKLLKKLATQLPGFKYSLFDYYTSLAQRTLYSSKFGFKVGKSACCGSGAYNGNFSCGGKNGTVIYTLCSNPSEYVWFDAGHPTESTNKQLADLLWNGHPNVTAPYTLKMFFEM
ncbi:hypothetical protein L1049_004697 [Liquidambar formosana]|uniref:Uncharacterized protein n=1 Tax=Liquidambar formosana TaxID=63359 RepID=A0AAP0RU86_LIQFO